MLRDRRILVTREAEKARATADAVRAAGAVPVVFPTLEIVPPVDPAPLQAAARGLSGYAWVVVTSPTGARVFREALVAAGVAHLPGGPRLAAVGRATAAALAPSGDGVLVPPPDREDADGLLEALLATGAVPGPVLAVRAETGREVLIDGLRDAGATVDAVVGYRTVTARRTPAEVDALTAAPPDAGLFLSPSAFTGLLAILGPERARAFLARCPPAAIGRTTAAAIREAGFPPLCVAPEPTVDALLAAVASSLAALRDPPGIV
jgi:uroporphyrinogen-III synthase